jgi:predicted ATPase/DNA-binding SARP family transcriptional activator
MPHLTLSCFGPLQATLTGERLMNFHSVKAQALLAYLALEAERPHQRETLATLLWPLDAETSARASLRQTLYELRKLLGDRDDLDTPFLLVTRQTVQFNHASDHTLDVADFLSSIQKGKLEQAAALYRGELLTGLSCESEPFEEWLRQSRTRFHNLAVDVSFRLTDQALHQSNLVQARTYAQRQLALEPWREEAHRQLMTALALSGERSAALAQYETCRRVLADELGVEPDSETTALYEQIKAGKLRAARSDPLPVSPSLGEEPILHGAPPQTVRHNLPPQPTPFVGRQNDLAQIGARLADPDCRLLTIVGPGGMGKTRLAIQAAQMILDLGFLILDSAAPDDNPKSKIQTPKFADGLFFVALAGVASPDLLASAIATTLDFTFYGSADPKTQLCDYLKSKSVLIVLDNCEHLLDGIDLMSDLLGAAPQVKVLATSREPLNLREEWLHPLGGMSFPTESAGADEAVIGRLTDYTAVQFFVQCARQMKPGFDLAAEAAAVVRICRLVEGMPLGIELATSWLKLFPCAQVAREVEQSLDFLSTTLRNVPARHRSMKAVFEHSWRLLADQEQWVLQRLSIFRGGFDRTAAEQVAGATFPLLVNLAEKSLIQVAPGERYQIHELLRQFAEEKLAEQPQAPVEVQELHCTYFLNFLRQQEARLKGGEQSAALPAIEADIENVRLAWQWAVTHQKIGEIDRGLESLYLFYLIKCWYKEGVTAFEQAATALAMDEPAGKQGVLWGKLLARQAALWSWLDSHVGASSSRASIERLNQQSLTILNQLGAKEETGLAVSVIGGQLSRVGQFDQALKYYEQSLTVFAERGDQWGMSRTLHDLGFTCYWSGNYRAALDYFQRGVAICNQSGDLKNLGDLLNMVGEVYKMLGDFDAARQATQSALAARTAAGEKRGIAWSLQLLGELAWLTGDNATAEQHLLKSLALFREIGLTAIAAAASNILGEIATGQGNFAQARDYFRISLTPYLNTDLLYLNWLPSVALAGLVALLIREDRPAPAAELLYHVLRHPAALHETKERAQRLLADLATTLPPQVMAAAQTQAETQDLSATVAALLADVDESTIP